MEVFRQQGGFYLPLSVVALPLAFPHYKQVNVSGGDWKSKGFFASTLLELFELLHSGIEAHQG
jgi:hypothetical protein